MTRQPAFFDGKGRRVRRRPCGTSACPPLEAAIQREMNRPPYPTRAFVLAACAGYALGVDEQADYHESTRRKNGRRR